MAVGALLVMLVGALLASLDRLVTILRVLAVSTRLAEGEWIRSGSLMTATGEPARCR